MRQRARVRRCSHACARAWSARAASAGGTQTSQHVRAVSAGFEMSRAPYSRTGSRRTQTAAGRATSTWAQPAEHDAIIKLQHLHELQMLTAYTSHMDTRVSMEHVRAGAGARACVACDCSRTQSGAAHHETRSTKRSARVEPRRTEVRPGRREVGPKKGLPPKLSTSAQIS